MRIAQTHTAGYKATWRHRLPLIAAILAMVTVGCESSRSNVAGPSAPAASAPPAAASNTSAKPNAAVPALIAEGQPVMWPTLQPLLAEAVGGQVLADWLLDRLVQKELQSGSITLTDADLESERQLYLQQLSENPDEAARLLQEVRDRQGMGPRRFSMMLRTNAGLRKLVAGEVAIDEATLDTAYKQIYGEKSQVRMILVDTLPTAQRALDRLRAGEAFVDLVFEYSADVSRSQGGLLPVISEWDPTFPPEIRKAAAQLAPDQVSGIIAVEGGYAILLGVRKIPAQQVDRQSVEPRLRQIVRLRLERELMLARGRALLNGVDVTVLDPDLGSAWDLHKKLMFTNP